MTFVEVDRNGWPETRNATWSQVHNADRSRTLVSWVTEVRTVGGLASRTQLLLDLKDLKPTRPGKRKMTTRPGLVENAGAAALADLASAEPSKLPWIVRIYYISMADEKVFAEFRVSQSEAHHVYMSATGSTRVESWADKPQKVKCRKCTVNGTLLPPKKRVGCENCLGTGKIEESRRPPPHHGYRQVVFPSERTEPIEISVEVTPV